MVKRAADGRRAESVKDKKSKKAVSSELLENSRQNGGPCALGADQSAIAADQGATNSTATEWRQRFEPAALPS